MKILLISLALAVFAGSQAFVIRSAPEPDAPSKLAEFIKEIEHVMEELDNSTDKRWEQLKKTETSKIITKWLDHEDEAPAEAQAEAHAEGQAPKEEESFVEAVVDLFSDMLDAAEKAFEEVVEKQGPKILEKFKEEVISSVGHRLDPAVDRLRPHVTPLLKALVSQAQSVDHEMDQSFQGHLDLLDQHVPQYLQKLSDYAAKLT